MNELKLTESKQFPRGTVVRMHCIGTHEITEYVVGGDFKDAGKTEFGVARNGFKDWMSADTLDEAILLSLFLKYVDEGDLPYVMRLLGMKGGEE